jgi:hypothetical protein
MIGSKVFLWVWGGQLSLVCKGHLLRCGEEVGKGMWPAERAVALCIGEFVPLNLFGRNTQSVELVKGLERRVPGDEPTVVVPGEGGLPRGLQLLHIIAYNENTKFLNTQLN